MNTHFSILPWEFRGAEFSPQAHAQTELEIGGKTRDLLLKMREGVVYFKEPARVPVYAVTKQFERELRAEELEKAWREEVGRENFGRFVVYQPNFPGTSASTVLAMVHRADHSGWVREWFRPDWIEVPVHRDTKQLDVWGTNFQNATRRAFRHTQSALLNCALSAQERCSLQSNWTVGSEAELRRVFALVLRLYVRQRGADSRRTWFFAACNPASNGGFVDTFNPHYHHDAQFSPSVGPLLKLLEQHFVWTAMNWKHNSSFASDHALQSLADKWGTSWRGHYSVSTPRIKISVPLVASLSSHEKLESLLELRAWLDGKIPPKQSARLLNQALD